MQWKEPFEVCAVVGLNDYRVKVKGKYKVYHANLLKRYLERTEPTEESAVTTKASAAVTREEDAKYEPDIEAQVKVLTIFWRLVDMWLRSRSPIPCELNSQKRWNS